MKARLKLHIGTPVEHQRLILKRDGISVCEISDNTKMLGFYSVQSGNEIHIIDTDPFSLSRGGGLTDVSLIQKYKMADDEYDKRSGTMRDYIRKQREKDPNFKLKPKSLPPPRATEGAAASMAVSYGAETVVGIEVGMRCQVMPGARRGIVQFVGELDGLKTGHWVNKIGFIRYVPSN